MLLSVALLGFTLAQAEGARLQSHGKGAHPQSSIGHAASPVDMGAQCRAQARDIWPNPTNIQGASDKPYEMLFNACMSNGGRIPGP
jgi:hypothetical protein